MRGARRFLPGAREEIRVSAQDALCAPTATFGLAPRLQMASQHRTRCASRARRASENPFPQNLPSCSRRLPLRFGSFGVSPRDVV